MKVYFKKGVSFSIEQIFYAILAFVLIVLIGVAIANADVKKYLDFIPDFGDDEDKIIGNVNEVKDIGDEGEESEIADEVEGSEDEEVGEFFLETEESCCCFYENNLNTDRCQIVELEQNQYCSNKLESDWRNVDDKYCKKSPGPKSVESVIKKPWWKFW